MHCELSHRRGAPGSPRRAHRGVSARGLHSVPMMTNMERAAREELVPRIRGDHRDTLLHGSGALTYLTMRHRPSNWHRHSSELRIVRSTATAGLANERRSVHRSCTATTDLLPDTSSMDS